MQENKDELIMHDHGDGAVHSHTAGEMHEHVHKHTETKAVINRLSRAIGHLESVKRMVENGRDCTEVLIQLAAVRSALSNTAKVILKDHLEHCIYDSGIGEAEQIKALNDAIDKFMS
ncbi:MAG: metal-sensing transcriptional repressor [Candidatus Limivicinus sp.]|jgi:DNA-binding FrmR family transcriptional regulator